VGEEVLFEPPAGAPPVTRARSTIVLAARGALFDAGHRAPYEAALDPAAGRALDAVVAGNWLPLDVLRAHYRACDTLGLSANNIAVIGRSVNDRIKGTLYGTFIRVFQEAGGNPWNVLPHWQRFWDRGYEGGALRIVKLGPKDVRVEVLGCSLCESHYFRNSLRGISNGFIEVFCKRAYATEVGYGGDRVSYRYQWA
jgi:hypothetical protein